MAASYVINRIGPPIISGRNLRRTVSTSTFSQQELLSAQTVIFSPVSLQGQFQTQQVDIFVDTPTPDLPQWLMPTLTALKDLLNLRSGWNSYHARPIRRSIVLAAVDLLSSFMLRNTPIPQVVPTFRGGLQLEWHIGSVDLEIIFDSPTHVHFCVDADNQEITGFLPNDFPKLRPYMSRISSES